MRKFLTIIIGCLLILGFIVVSLYKYNHDYFQMQHLVKQPLSLQKATLKDLTTTSSGLISKSNDPWIEFQNVNATVSRIQVNADYNSMGSLLQVFYTNSQVSGYNEQDSASLMVNEDKGSYILDFGTPIQIKNLRVDITNIPDVSVSVSQFILNPPLPFEWHAKELTGHTILFVFLVLILYIGYKKMNLLIKRRYIIASVCFVFLVLFKLHGSSIGMWDTYIPSKEGPVTTIIGTERSIRSDEWLVQTPYMLSQAQTAKWFEYDNPNIRSDGQNMVLANAPTYTIETLGKPFYWGFLLLGVDYGLSWYWFSKLILLLLFSFEISMFITRGNKIVSLLGAVWIGFSPPVQWWYTTGAGVIELIIYSQAIVVCALYFFKCTKVWHRLLLVLGFTIAVLGFIFTLYPAVQVPLGILTFIFFAYIIYEGLKNKRIQLIKIDYFLFGFSVVFIGIAGVLFLINCKQDISLLMNTAYPGKRFITGGGYNFTDMQLYLISWLLPYKEVNFANSSSVSSFINFMPALILTYLFIFQVKRKAQNFTFVYLLLAYFIFQISWLFISYPHWFAQLSLFSFVPETRLYSFTTGMTATYLSIWFVSEILDKKIKWQHATVISFFIFLLYYYSVYHSEMQGYLLGFGLLAIFGFTCLNFILMIGMKRLFLTSMIGIILISGLTVNPLARGTASIYEKDIAKAIQQINTQDPNQKWMALDSIVNGQYLIALGMKSFNSVHFYPDFEMWKKLDPTRKYDEVYNRYAHVMVSLTDKPTNFVLKQSDNFVVNLNLKDISKTEVKYILSVVNLDDRIELQQMYYDSVSNMYIYKVK